MPSEEDLDRIEDIRSELASQLRRLQRQSQAARRYQKLRDEERVVNGQLLAVRYATMKRRSEEQDRSTAQARNQVEAELAQQRSLESTVEEIRAQQSDAQKLVNDIQAEFYTLGAEVASIEQKIEHTRETEQQQRAEKHSQPIHTSTSDSAAPTATSTTTTSKLRAATVMDEDEEQRLETEGISTDESGPPRKTAKVQR